MTMADVADKIRETVTANDVVLFMKGTKSMPQCGFSSRVAGVLNFMGVEFADVNVLADEGSARASRTIPTGRRSRSSTSRANSSAAATSSPR
jgi:glutaredoxin-related protein